MIAVNLDVMLAKRKISSLELAKRIGLTPANLCIFKTGKAKSMRFAALEAICRELQCQPGDILEFREEEQPESTVDMEAIERFYKAVGGPLTEDGRIPEGIAPHEAIYKALEASVALTQDENA